MKTKSLLAVAFAASFSLAAAAAPDNPFDAFKGKMKAGLYEYRVDMDMGQMPGMPPGMGKQHHTMQHCVTAEDINKGEVGRGGRDGKMPQNCEMKNFKMSGDTASYTMVCKGGPDMTADNRIAFRNDGFSMDMNMSMDQGGHPMHMKQHIESRYLGACK